MNVSNLHAPSKMYSLGLLVCGKAFWTISADTYIHVNLCEYCGEGLSRFHGLGALFFLISNLYRFIIAVLLFSAVPTACGFCGYMVVFAEAGFCWFRASERGGYGMRWLGKG